MRRQVMVGVAAAALVLGACEGSSDGGAPAAGGAAAAGGGPAGGGGTGGAGGGPDGGVGGAPAAPEGPTWYGAVAEVLATRCGRCHREGGGAPFSLLDYATARAYGPAAVAAIESGRMPPWMPDPDCRRYRDERLMPDDEKALVRRWVEAGMPEGEPRAVPPPPDDPVGEGDIVARPLADYVADASRPDDYRCFPLDATFEADTFVIGTRVAPGDPRTVHHVLVYVVEPDRVPELEALDAREDGTGYTCFGGPGVSIGGPLAGWVPGATPIRFEDGVAAVIPAGSRLVMQVHYNTLAAEPRPDRTEFHLLTRADPPERVARSRPLAHFEIEIPAGDPESVHVREFVNRSDRPWVIGATAPHMHVLGTRIKTEVVRADGTTECLVDIPDWDFNWQQTYLFRPGEEAVVRPGDKLRLTCVYDNSPANQPVINGEQLQPRTVTWGEGTLDEMCLNFVSVLEPYRPPSALCETFADCRAACEDPDGAGCVLDCLGGDQTCGECVLTGLIGRGGCARAACAAPLGAAAGCLRTCIVQAIGEEASIDDCLERTCPEERTDLYACLEPLLASGACDGALQACNVGP